MEEEHDPTVNLTTEQIIKLALELGDDRMIISTPVTDNLEIWLYVGDNILTEVYPSLYVNKNGIHASFHLSEDGANIDGGMVDDPATNIVLADDIVLKEAASLPVRLNIHDVIELFCLSNPLWDIAVGPFGRAMYY